MSRYGRSGGTWYTGRRPLPNTIERRVQVMGQAIKLEQLAARKAAREQQGLSAQVSRAVTRKTAAK